MLIERKETSMPNDRNVGWAIRCAGESVFRLGDIPPMARQAHLEAAKHHLEAARLHLDAANKYSDGDPDAAERFSDEARAAAKTADSKSAEAHGRSRMDARRNMVWLGNSVAGWAAVKES
jgi:hypothetical protein